MNLFTCWIGYKILVNVQLRQDIEIATQLVRFSSAGDIESKNSVRPGFGCVHVIKRISMTVAVNEKLGVGERMVKREK